MICTKNKLEQEIDFIKTILLGNGYPEDTVLKHISKKIAQFSTAKPLRPENCPVYLRAPWIGSASQQLEHQVKSAVQNCYGAVSPRLIFSSQCMLPAAKKDVLPANQRSMVIYEYVCQCDCQFVDHTTQRLQQRIKQHVPKAIKQKTNLTQEQRTHRSQPTRTQPNRKCKEKSKTQLEPESDSAIGQHLLQSNQCAHNYSDSHFKILTTARSQFHLNLLEAVYISRKKTDLCRQKQFIFTLQACCHWIDCVSPYLLCNLLKMHFSLLQNAFLLTGFGLEKIQLTTYQTRQRSQLKSSVRKACCESKMKSILLKVIFKFWPLQNCSDKNFRWNSRFQYVDKQQKWPY